MDLLINPVEHLAEGRVVAGKFSKSTILRTSNKLS